MTLEEWMSLEPGDIIEWVQVDNVTKRITDRHPWRILGPIECTNPVNIHGVHKHAPRTYRGCYLGTDKSVYDNVDKTDWDHDAELACNYPLWQIVSRVPIVYKLPRLMLIDD